MIIRLFPNGSTRNRRLQTLHPGRGATSDAWNRVSMMTLVFKAENRTAQLSAHPQGYDWALLMWQWWNEPQTQRRAVIRYAKMSFVNIFILGYISSIFFGISLLRKQSSPPAQRLSCLYIWRFSYMDAICIVDFRKRQAAKYRNCAAQKNCSPVSLNITLVSLNSTPVRRVRLA